MNRYVSVKAKCPFYKSENRFMVVCEGICENSVTHIAFSAPSVCYQFKSKYCRDEYQECPIARMLEVNTDA